MSTYFGNLSVDEMERRAGVEFPTELKDYMEPRRQQRANNVKPGKWHCFDVPFLLVCGDIETATEICYHLGLLRFDFKEPIRISHNEEGIVMPDFEREDRYLVLKRSDIEKYLPDDQKKLLYFVAGNIRDDRTLDGKEPLQCVVVEHDWPEYETTWAAIERRVTGA